MTPQHVDPVHELLSRIAELAERSPTFRVVVGRRVLALLQLLRQPEREQEPVR